MASRVNNSHLVRPLKMRMSCNSCQKSKVKCGQEKPICERCSRHHVECHYSPSRRAGRPRPRKEARDQNDNHQCPTPENLDDGSRSRAGELGVQAPSEGQLSPSHSLSSLGNGDLSDIIVNSRDTYAHTQREHPLLLDITQSQICGLLGEEDVMNNDYQVGYTMYMIYY